MSQTDANCEICSSKHARTYRMAFGWTQTRTRDSSNAAYTNIEEERSYLPVGDAYALVCDRCADAGGDLPIVKIGGALLVIAVVFGFALVIVGEEKEWLRLVLGLIAAATGFLGIWLVGYGLYDRLSPQKFDPETDGVNVAWGLRYGEVERVLQDVDVYGIFYPKAGLFTSMLPVAEPKILEQTKRRRVILDDGSRTTYEFALTINSTAVLSGNIASKQSAKIVFN